MLQDNIEYSFATDIPESDYQIIVDCPFFKDWIAKARKDFAVTHIHVDSVDYFSRVHRPLFIKITATATLPDGRPVHGVVLLRGNAVGVLVVLRCEGKKYLLLVRQPRLAITEEASGRITRRPQCGMRRRPCTGIPALSATSVRCTCAGKALSGITRGRRSGS